jgi:hypothetical protein
MLEITWNKRVKDQGLDFFNIGLFTRHDFIFWKQVGGISLVSKIGIISAERISKNQKIKNI